MVCLVNASFSSLRLVAAEYDGSRMVLGFLLWETYLCPILIVSVCAFGIFADLTSVFRHQSLCLFVVCLDRGTWPMWPLFSVQFVIQSHFLRDSRCSLLMDSRAPPGWHNIFPHIPGCSDVTMGIPCSEVVGHCVAVLVLVASQHLTDGKVPFPDTSIASPSLVLHVSKCPSVGI